MSGDPLVAFIGGGGWLRTAATEGNFNCLSDLTLHIELPSRSLQLQYPTAF